MKNYILIIGSKPNSKLPIANIDWVFSANGAAEKGDLYCKKFKIYNHSCVVGTREFEKNPKVSSRVMRANLKEIIFRYGKLSSPEFAIKNQVKIINFSKFDQFFFQKKFFDNSFFDLLYSELSYESNFYKKLRYFFYCVFRKGFLCSSTGLFSILYALENFQNHQIIISGIGPTQNIDDHFYDNSTNYSMRSKVDHILFNKIKKKYKERLFSTDDELSKKYDLLMWNRKTFL